VTTIGTRGSQLARWQAEWVRTRLAEHGVKADIVLIKTKGDAEVDRPLHEMEGKGFFTKEIEDALLEKRIDIAVHSLKDLPTALPPGLALGAIPARHDPREALVHGTSLLALPAGSRIGTSSLRRMTQVRYLRPDLEDVVFLTLRYPGGVLAGIQVSWLDPVKDRTVTVVGDQKMVVFDDVNPTEKLRVYDKGASYQPAGEEFAEFMASVRDGDIIIPRVRPGEPLKEQLVHFMDCIRNGRKPISDAADGLAIVRTLEQAQAELDKTRGSSEQMAVVA